MNFVDSETLAHTEAIESTWGNDKIRNKPMFGIQLSMIDFILCELLRRRRKAKITINTYFDKF